MEFYYAPLEGITGYVYRKAHHEYFPHMDKYFIPFLTAKENSRFSTKEKNEISRENNAGTHTIPQIIGNHAESFIHTAKELQKLGYEEINLNLGCPSGTVVAKKKGAGFFNDLDALERFLTTIFEELDLKISIKTRLGMTDPEEFEEILELYNQFPLSELIVHPRVREDYYKKPLHQEQFLLALEKSKCPVCYNGDIFNAEDFQQLQKKYPKLNRVMLGRGLVCNPGLVEELKTGKIITKEEFQDFHQRLYEDHKEVLFGDKTVLFHMKELWFYMICMFQDYQKIHKKLCKAQNLKKYEEIVDILFQEYPFLPVRGYQPPEKRGF